MNELTARFPNLTVVDVSAAMRQAQGVVDQVITAVQVVFMFALGAGLLVLVFLAARPVWVTREPPASATRAVMLLRWMSRKRGVPSLTG